MNPYKASLLRLPRVMEMTGLSETSIRRLIAAKAFPDSVQVSDRAVAWRHTEIQAWIDSRTPKSVAQGSKK